MKKTLGGDRLGSGKKLKVELHNYERSTHDLSYLWRSTMSAGTLVPFLKKLALPGDTFDIDLDCDIKTHPTIGPLFGSYKVQLDVFQAPIRLYQGQLHNNKLGIGLNMANVKLPLISLRATPVNVITAVDTLDVDNMQINPSCILAYLGIRGVGVTNNNDFRRDFQAIPILAYWDIYKNYYANKQEEIGAVIHTPITAPETEVVEVRIDGTTVPQAPLSGSVGPINVGTSQLQVEVGVGQTQDLTQVIITLANDVKISAADIGLLLSFAADTYTILIQDIQGAIPFAKSWNYLDPNETVIKPIEVATFNLEDIDTMRERILAHATQTTPFSINGQGVGLEPYAMLLDEVADFTSMMQSQEGLGLKTYQSDLFNNWLQTEWIDGAGGINEITAIDTSTGSFTIDTLNLSKKVYDMLNRIAVSGGSYEDWLDAVYTHEAYWRAETPMYCGGLIKELGFQEVVSNAEAGGTDTGTQPLGTIAGKGIMLNKHKGGKITVKVDEPSYIIGIISLTPRVDYSQGNEWDTHLLTMDDLHKPALDEIGFQELITEQMAWWSTNEVGDEWVTRSAGKQPAWINYMTAVNKVLGNFAIADNEMFMTLNRKYTPVVDTSQIIIEDLTTYINPSKFNNIFAQTSLDSQNFWAQISVDITARRKLSAKLMPNL